MTTKTFGRRGAVPQAAGPLLRPNAAAAIPAAFAADRAIDASPLEATQENRLLAHIPILTIGMIVFLLLIFGAETRLAFDVGRNGDLSVGSLIAFGAISYDLVIGSGEWWRVTLAPLLHASYSHLLGNSFALFFVGVRLEPMIGRAWFGLIFIVSALGGVAGSLLGNPHGVPSVGASGAITGIIGALFVVSFHHRADAVEQHAMRLTSLRFGIPALLPLAIGASGQVDYFAHAGGAIAGGAAGLILCSLWSTDSLRSNATRLAAMAVLAGLAASSLSAAVAATHYSTYAANAANFIPAAAMPGNMKDSAKRSAELLARYPKDPRAHLMRAVSLVDAHRNHDAEMELRTAMDLAASDPTGRPVRDVAQAILAVVMAEQGRRDEAKALAADACHAKDQVAVHRILDKTKLCD